MVNLDNLQFQKLDLTGMKTLVQWADEEGYNPGPYDAKAYFETVVNISD